MVSGDGPLSHGCSFSLCSHVSEGMKEVSWASFIDLFIFHFFLRTHLLLMEDPGLGLKLELQLPTCATATAVLVPSRICDLHLSLRQHQILNLQSEARV